MTVAEVFDRYLPFFDKDDPIYKSVLSYVSGIPELMIADPMDYNIGVIAGMLEWNRHLVIGLKKQIFLDLAEGKYLDLIAHDHIGIVRKGGENDLDYVARIQDWIIGHKVSPGSIIFATRKYSPGGEPVIREGEFDSAFADATFADNTKKMRISGSTVYPAYAQGADTMSFFFILILKNTVSADVPELLGTLRRIVAPGIGYEIRVEY